MYLLSFYNWVTHLFYTFYYRHRLFLLDFSILIPENGNILQYDIFLSYFLLKCILVFC